MEIRLNIGYFKSFQGIIKIVQLVRVISSNLGSSSVVLQEFCPLYSVKQYFAVILNIH